MQIGCDPKSDSTKNLMGGKRIPTVLEQLKIRGEDLLLEDIVFEGFSGVLCVEAGGPTPGIGCAGRGIISAFEKLSELKAFEKYKPEIVVHFRETPHQMFRCEGGHCPRANKLILRLQPNEGIVLKFGMKTPGPGFDVKQVMMDFSYDQLGGLPTGDAYARLIEDCIQGDPTLFTRSDAVEASWRFFDPVLRYWKEHTDAPLYGYPVGTWGPLESEAMMHEHGAEWTNPCKNLTNTDEYCEL